MIRLQRKKNECIDWTLGLDCRYQFWPWPWPWPWIFVVKFLNSCISGMAGPIDVKWKGSESIGCWANNVTLTFDHTHGFDHGFSRLNFEITLSVEWEGWLTLSKRNLSRSIMTMTMTFWWPRWCVRNYQRVSEVTSEVGVPRTLVFPCLFLYPHPTKLEGGILDSPCPSVRPSVRLSVCL